MPQDHKKLRVYKKAFLFSKQVYRETASFPKEETYGIVNQLRRASSSIGANIAEGSGSQTNKKFVSFLFYSLGSAKECQHFLDLSRELGYIREETHMSLNDEIEALCKMLSMLIQKERSDHSTIILHSSKGISFVKAMLMTSSSYGPSSEK